MPRLVVELNVKEFAKVSADAKKQGKSKTDYVKAALGLKPSIMGRPPVKKQSKKKE